MDGMACLSLVLVPSLSLHLTFASPLSGAGQERGQTGRQAGRQADGLLMLRSAAASGSSILAARPHACICSVGGGKSLDRAGERERPKTIAVLPAA